MWEGGEGCFLLVAPVGSSASLSHVLVCCGGPCTVSPSFPVPTCRGDLLNWGVFFPPPWCDDYVLLVPVSHPLAGRLHRHASWRSVSSRSFVSIRRSNYTSPCFSVPGSCGHLGCCCFPACLLCPCCCSCSSSGNPAPPILMFPRLLLLAILLLVLSVFALSPCRCCFPSSVLPRPSCSCPQPFPSSSPCSL